VKTALSLKYEAHFLLYESLLTVTVNLINQKKRGSLTAEYVETVIRSQMSTPHKTKLS